MSTTITQVNQINEHAAALIAAGKRITVTGEEETNVFHGAIERSGDISLTYGRNAPKQFPRKGSYAADIESGDASRLITALKAGKKRFSCIDTDGEPLVVAVE